MTLARRILTIQALLWLALILALVGSLRHVAWGFAGLEGGEMLTGYVQAVAVDVGLLALALGIQARKRQRRGTVSLWVGVMMFSAVSTYANLLHGLAHQTDIGLGADLAWLVSLRPLLLSGVLPALVIYLSEIAGADVNHAVKLADKEVRRQERERAREQEKAQRARVTHASQAAGALVEFYTDNPHATQATAGEHVGKSRQWVSAQLARLEEQGVVARNGRGVEVTIISE